MFPIFKNSNFVFMTGFKINKMNDKPRLFQLSHQKPLYQMFVALMIIVGVGITLSFILIMAGTADFWQ